MEQKILGLILKQTKFGEAHAYVTALTEEGLVTFLAYGIQSKKKKSFVACQPFTLTEIILQKKGDTLSLKECDTVRHLISQGVDFEGLTLANYVVTMAGETAFDIEDAPSILKITSVALDAINKKSAPCNIIKAVFELSLLSALGFSPDLSLCTRCSSPVDSGLFSSREGGVICERCSALSEVGGIRTDGELLRAMRHLLALDVKSALGIRFTEPSQERAFCTIAEEFAVEQLDSAIGALKFYKENIKNF